MGICSVRRQVFDERYERQFFGSVRRVNKRLRLSVFSVHTNVKCAVLVGVFDRYFQVISSLVASGVDNIRRGRHFRFRRRCHSNVRSASLATVEINAKVMIRAEVEIQRYRDIEGVCTGIGGNGLNNIATILNTNHLAQRIRVVDL